jgi:putative SOS response-associated peptidase YedK
MATNPDEILNIHGEIHDRMPVILGSSDEGPWLDPEIHEQEALEKVLKPCPSSWLEAVEISTLVNSPKNNTSEVLEPVVTTTQAGGRVRDLFEL